MPTLEELIERPFPLNSWTIEADGSAVKATALFKSARGAISELWRAARRARAFGYSARDGFWWTLDHRSVETRMSWGWGTGRLDDELCRRLGVVASNY